MTEREERRAARAKQVKLGLVRFIFMDPNRLWSNREDVVTAALAAESFGGRLAKLASRVEKADRPTKLAKALRVLNGSLGEEISGRTSSTPAKSSQERSPRLPPHPRQSLSA